MYFVVSSSYFANGLLENGSKQFYFPFNYENGSLEPITSDPFYITTHHFSLKV